MFRHSVHYIADESVLGASSANRCRDCRDLPEEDRYGQGANGTQRQRQGKNLLESIAAAKQNTPLTSKGIPCTICDSIRANHCDDMNGSGAGQRPVLQQTTSPWRERTI